MGTHQEELARNGSRLQIRSILGQCWTFDDVGGVDRSIRLGRHGILLGIPYLLGLQMTRTEKRILSNQVEIMNTLAYLLKCAAPSLVGLGGELDYMRDHLLLACKDTEHMRHANDQD